MDRSARDASLRFAALFWLATRLAPYVLWWCGLLGAISLAIWLYELPLAVDALTNNILAWVAVAAGLVALFLFSPTVITQALLRLSGLNPTTHWHGQEACRIERGVFNAPTIRGLEAKAQLVDLDQVAFLGHWGNTIFITRGLVEILGEEQAGYLVAHAYASLAGTTDREPTPWQILEHNLAPLQPGWLGGYGWILLCVYCFTVNLLLGWLAVGLLLLGLVFSALIANGRFRADWWAAELTSQLGYAGALSAYYRLLKPPGWRWCLRRRLREILLPPELVDELSARGGQ